MVTANENSGVMERCPPRDFFSPWEKLSFAVSKGQAAMVLTWSCVLSHGSDMVSPVLSVLCSTTEKPMSAKKTAPGGHRDTGDAQPPSPVLGESFAYKLLQF